MKITKRHLRRIIKESLLKEEMLKIIANPHSPETETFNRIANYAINDDLQGALADTEWVNTPDLDLDLDSMGEWVGRVGDPSSDWMEDDVVVPDNWDPDMVWGFMKKLENAWYDQRGKAADAEHTAAPDVAEREAIGAVLTRGFILPKDLPSITYQIRRKGGKVSNINVEDDNTVGNIDSRDVENYSTTFDKIIGVLEKNGAQLRKKRKSRKYSPSMYD